MSSFISYIESVEKGICVQCIWYLFFSKSVIFDKFLIVLDKASLAKNLDIGAIHFLLFRNISWKEPHKMKVIFDEEKSFPREREGIILQQIKTSEAQLSNHDSICNFWLLLHLQSSIRLSLLNGLNNSKIVGLNLSRMLFLFVESMKQKHAI